MNKETYRPLENPFLVNLKNCEDEPIHLLGKLQAHGSLLAFDSKSEKLKYFSESSIPLIDEFDDLDELDLKHLFDGATLRTLREFMKSGSLSWLSPDPVILKQRKHSLHLSQSDDLLIIEFEEYDVVGKHELLQKISGLESFLGSNKEYSNKLDLLTDAVIHFRKLTGFDRVMCYRFDENGDGEVVAEDRKMGLESFLGLRYPASDIPPQARRLYLTNLVRSIRDISDDGIPIYGVGTEEMLDLSHAVYRSVSPIHLQYLRNMGVTATHANSLILNGKLWGMMICHHYAEPKTLSFAERALTLYYCSGISRYANNLKERERQTHLNLRQRLIHLLEANTSESLFEGLRSVKDLLESTLDICGFSVLEEEEWTSFGVAPEIDELLKFEYRLRSLPDKTSFYVSVDEFVGPSSPKGCAAIHISSNPKVLALLYRPEKKRIFNWAGDPSKAVAKGKSGELTPRKSFELWQEKVDGESLPWTDDEKQFIAELRMSSIVNLEYLKNNGVSLTELEMLKHRQRSLKKELEEQRIENENLVAELSDVMSVQTEVKELESVKHLILSNLSHEMRTPLNGIMGLAEIMQLDEVDESTRKEYASLILKSGWRMLDTFNRLTHLENLHSIPKREQDTVENFINEVLSTYAVLASKAGASVSWKVHNKKKTILRHSTLVHLVLSNLVANSLRHAGPAIHVNVDVRFTSINGKESMQIDVEDNGKGIASDIIGQVFEPFFTRSEVTKGSDQSTGLGLYIVRSYVESVGGSIQVESTVKEGTRFRVSIPISTQ